MIPEGERRDCPEFEYFVTEMEAIALNPYVLAGPLIGAVIGYITNYIAIKMLFRPLKPLYILGVRVPFTPGIIPRRKSQLADALGKAVFKRFFNWDDLEQVFLSDEFCERVCTSIKDSVENGSAKDIRDNLSRRTVNRIKDAIAEHVRHAMIIQGYSGLAKVASDAARTMMDKADEEAGNDAGADRLRELMDDAFGEDREPLMEILRVLYRDLMKKYVRNIVECVDIESQITDKLNLMDAGEVEVLVLDIVDKELKMVVRFGAFLGALIGVINSLIYLT